MVYYALPCCLCNVRVKFKQDPLPEGRGQRGILGFLAILSNFQFHQIQPYGLGFNVHACVAFLQHNIF